MKHMKSSTASVLSNLGLCKEEKSKVDVKNSSSNNTVKKRTPVEIFNEEFKKEPTTHELSFQG